MISIRGTMRRAPAARAPRLKRYQLRRRRSRQPSVATARRSLFPCPTKKRYAPIRLSAPRAFTQEMSTNSPISTATASGTASRTCDASTPTAGRWGRPEPLDRFDPALDTALDLLGLELEPAECALRRGLAM